MKRFIVLPSFLPVLIVVVLMMAASIEASDNGQQSATRWQSPSEELLQVLHAPQLPRMGIPGEFPLIHQGPFFVERRFNHNGSFNFSTYIY